MSSAIIDRVRQPEYTGANRCMPCTVLNVAIALVIAAVLGWLAIPAGVGFLVIALSAIALRGYLVPGTPELTRRYLPDRIHRLFGHGPTRVHGDEEFLERTLLEWEVLEPCAHEDDVCLNERFAEAFRDRILEYRDKGVDEELIAPIFDADPDDIRLLPRSPPQIRYRSGRTRWPSTAALLADAAIANVLAEELTEWDETPLQRRGPILAGLRPFLESCPACGGDTELDEKVVESCCRRDEVLRIQCRECQSTIFEVDAAAVAEMD